jgi:hypothetical protein
MINFDPNYGFPDYPYDYPEIDDEQVWTLLEFSGESVKLAMEGQRI